jgi:hypothetical protein
MVAGVAVRHHQCGLAAGLSVLHAGSACVCILKLRDCICVACFDKESACRPH